MRLLHPSSVAPLLVALWLLLPTSPLGAIGAKEVSGPSSRVLWKPLRDGAASRHPAPCLDHRPDAATDPPTGPWPDPLPEPEPLPGHRQPPRSYDELDEWDTAEDASEAMGPALDDREEGP